MIRLSSPARARSPPSVAVVAARRRRAASPGRAPVAESAVALPAVVAGPPTVPAAPSQAAGGADCPTAGPGRWPAARTTVVTIETAKGTIVIKVEADLAPLAAGNFVALAGVRLLRRGRLPPRRARASSSRAATRPGPAAAGPGYKIKDDPVTAPYTRGTVAMANAGPDTNGTQFFIVLKDDPEGGLAPAVLAIFGQVTTGMEVVDAIAAAADAREPDEPDRDDQVTVAKP